MNEETLRAEVLYDRLKKVNVLQIEPLKVAAFRDLTNLLSTGGQEARLMVILLSDSDYTDDRLTIAICIKSYYSQDPYHTIAVLERLVADEDTDVKGHALGAFIEILEELEPSEAFGILDKIDLDHLFFQQSEHLIG